MEALKTRHSGQRPRPVVAKLVGEEVHELNDENSPPPRERLGNLAEPGPQRSDRTMRHSSCAGLPHLAPLALALALAAAAEEAVNPELSPSS